MARHEHAHEILGIAIGFLASDHDFINVFIVEITDCALDQRAFLVNERWRG